MKKLLLLVGPPGSGKSTLAIYHEDNGYVRISQDVQGKEHLNIFFKALEEGKSVTIDRMNFDKRQRARYLEPAKAAGYHTEICVIHQPKSVCLERCLKRKNHETIKDSASAHQALNLFFGRYERPTLDEADEVQFIYPQLDMVKPKTIIIDLDSTLCNIDHRLHFVRSPARVLVGPDKVLLGFFGNFEPHDLDKPLTKFKKDWKNFFANIPGDTVNEWCADLVKALSKNYQIVYCSGRPDDHREATVDWLKDNGLFSFDHSYIGGLKQVPELYMRPRNDSRQDNVVKQNLLDFEILTRYEPYLIVDDRKQVCEMWRSRGLTTLQCAEGNF